MKYAVKGLSAVAVISCRTLRFYDEINLLNPEGLKRARVQQNEEKYGRESQVRYGKAQMGKANQKNVEHESGKI
ncbi:hypothetical protein [Carnobacterium divergens]|uniref:hypothetical protein n=1 Tax=Carnobacterium divergens TaxID=2748 RepID=UPI001431EFC4|nr:hypothetical protein [Carnobacterium divergens]